MNFVQNSFLIAGAAVAIPIVVHLLNRHQVRKVELGTMRFLQEIIQDGSQKRRLRRWLLLAVRTLVMLLLAMLFARPYFIERLSGRNGNRSRLILIDRSSSMGMKGSEGRLIDDAVAAAIDAADELGDQASVVHAWFDRHVEPMPEDGSIPVAPRTVVGSTDYGAAIRWAKTAIDARPGEAVDVVLISDLQQNGLRRRLTVLATESFPTDVPVRLIDVGREAVNNLAISNISTDASRAVPGRPIKVDVTLFNYGSLPLEEIAAKAVAFDGLHTVRLRKSINIGAGEAQEVQFDLGKLERGTWQITVAVDVDDDLLSDNQRLTAVEVAAPTRVVVLDSDEPDTEELAASYFLSTALSQDGRIIQGPVGASVDADEEFESSARFAPEVVFVDAESIPSLSPAESPLVVVCDASDIHPPVLEILNSYVNRGGRLLVFAGDLTTSLIEKWDQSQLTPGPLKAPIRSGTMPFRIVSVDPDSRMMDPFNDPQHADLSRLSFRRLLPIAPRPETKVVAWFDENRPAITRQMIGEGQLVWFLSSADSQWSNWTSSPLYLPLVQQMAADLLNLTGEGRIRHRSVGDDDHRTPLTSQTSGDWTPVSTSARTIAETRESNLSGNSALRVFGSPGFEQFGDTNYVVNSEPRESDPARIDSDAFARHFGLTVDMESEATEVRLVTTEKRVEYWPWLAAVAFVLVFAEFCLANRTTA